MPRSCCSSLFAFAFTLFCILPATVSARAAQTSASAPPNAVRGVVVDSQDAVVVRAFVRVVDAHGRILAAGLTDERGRFSIAVPAATCQVQVSLAGFTTATAPCGTGDSRLVLSPAPIGESMVISATRDAAPTSQLGSAITVFTTDDIDRRGTPLVVDLLRATPGVTVVRTGGAGGQASLFVRGGESNYNKVLLDGIPLNEPGGTFNFGNLTTEQIERVEVVRGAESALFGSDAMSSVVQLFTRRARTPGTTGAVTAEAGTHESLRGSVSLSGRSAGWDFTVGSSRLQTDNHVPNNEFRNTTVVWNTGGAVAGRTQLRSIGRVESQRSGTPGATAFGRPDLDAFFDRRDVTAGLTVTIDAAALTTRASYGYARSRQISQNLVEDPPYTPAFEDRVGQFEFFDFPFHSDNRLERHHASVQADWRAGRALGAIHLLTAALDWDGERALLNDRLDAVLVPAERDNVGTSLQHQLVASRATIVTGVRLENNASFGTAVVPRIAAAIVLHEGGGGVGRTTVKATAGRGVKEPTILQSYSASSFFLGNPDLEAERSRAVSVGVEQRLAGDRAKIDVVWFDHRYRNQISTRTVSVSPFVSQYFNVGLTEARGLELSAAIAPSAQFRGRGGYTRLDSEIVESTSPFSPVFQAGQWAFRRPRHSGFVEGTWSRGKIDTSLFGQFTGTRVDSDFAELKPAMTTAPAYAIWTASVRYRLGRVDLSLRVENLTGTDYMEPLGFPAWGRTAHAAVRVRF
jgi:outer membrane cobalamin receptor